MTMAPPRFDHFDLPGQIRLGINRNEKIKTVFARVYLTSDLDDDVTRRALMACVLRRGTTRLPDMQAIDRWLANLWGAGRSASAGKIGEWHVARFGISVVNDRFLPGDAGSTTAASGLMGEGLRFLRDLVFDPLRVDGALRGDWVDQEKVNQRRTIESLIDDKGSYARFRCIEEMCRDEPYRRHGQGRVEELDVVDAVGLSEFWSDWARRTPLSIYVAGDVDPDAIRAEVEEVFDVPRSDPYPMTPVPPPVAVGDVREVREKLDVNQGRLVIGFRHGITYGDPQYDALVLMNGILGGYSHSKLFQNVREKASMAYSAYSAVERNKGLLFIACGIAVEKYEKAVEICLEQIDAMRRGDISDEEIDSTLKTILGESRMLEDDFSTLVEADFMRSLHGSELDLESFRARLRAVTRDDIVAAAERLQHDLTYFLHD